MTNVVISYRREDSAGWAGRIYDRLVEAFGQEHVFIDIDKLRPGEDFTAAITERVAACDALLALIGPRFTTAVNQAGQRKLDDPADWVCQEIGTALEQGAFVVPVLFDGAAMPPASALPERLKPLANRQSIEITAERFHQDMDVLVASLRQIRGGPATEAAPGARFRKAWSRGSAGGRPGERRPRGPLIAGVAVVAALIAAAIAIPLALVDGGGGGSSPAAPATPAETAAAVSSQAPAAAAPSCPPILKGMTVRIVPPAPGLAVRSLPTNADTRPGALLGTVTVERTAVVVSDGRYEDEGWYWRRVDFGNGLSGWVTDETLAAPKLGPYIVCGSPGSIVASSTASEPAPSWAVVVSTDSRLAPDATDEHRKAVAAGFEGVTIYHKGGDYYTLLPAADRAGAEALLPRARSALHDDAYLVVFAEFCPNAVPGRDFTDCR